MKKVILFLVIAALIAVPLLVGCGAEGRGRFTAIMGSSSLGGSWYPMASRMAGVAMMHGDVIVTVQASGGGMENIRLMRQGQYHMGLSEPNVAAYAAMGTGPFVGNVQDNIRFLFNMFPLPYTIIVHRDGPIQRVEDFNMHTNGGRRFGFSPGSPGSGDEFAWMDLFAVYGITRDMMNWRPLSHNERVMAFKDRILDSVGFQTASPSGAIIELSAQNPIRILPIYGEMREKAIRELPWLGPFTLPGGLYNGQPTPVETVFHGGFVLANADVPEDFIYAYVRAIWYYGLEEVQNVFPAARDMTLATALAGNSFETGVIPFHPGAERFWREMGLIQ
ncbi:MAG: TAXI family TRAP transporter solute-binding subunit [Spirochaetes bacterium]|nr:TAXI family TRAP transporter solute-binding subunit [Spirochaetota bacterium]